MRNLTRQTRGMGPTGSVPIEKPSAFNRPGPETHSWYWHPFRVGVRFAPAHFMKKIREFEITPRIEITWNPIRQHYQVWQEKPSLQHPICHGWNLLFNVCYADGSYMPLDERVMWKLYDRSIQLNPANGGSLKRYWDRIEAEMEREAAIAEKDKENDRKARTDPAFDFSQIKVSGCGHSNGSKFSTYMA